MQVIKSITLVGFLTLYMDMTTAFPRLVIDWRAENGLENFTIRQAPGEPTVAFSCGYSDKPTDSWNFMVMDTNGFFGMPYVPYEVEVNVSQWHFPVFQTFYNETRDYPGISANYHDFYTVGDCDPSILKKNNATTPPIAPFRVPGIGGYCGGLEASDIYYSGYWYYNVYSSVIGLNMYDDDYENNWFAQSDNKQWFEYVATRYVYYPKYLFRESDEDIAYRIECEIWSEPTFPPRITKLSRCKDAPDTVEFADLFCAGRISQSDSVVMFGLIMSLAFLKNLLVM